jgi:hypothetical protein
MSGLLNALQLVIIAGREFMEMMTMIFSPVNQMSFDTMNLLAKNIA